MKNDKIKITDYTQTYFECLKFMSHLGPYISIGFKDLQHKALTINGNVQIMQEKLKFINSDEKASVYICEFIKIEDKLGILNMNSANNED